MMSDSDYLSPSESEHDFSDMSDEAILRQYFVYWGQYSGVYDGNGMTWRDAEYDPRFPDGQQEEGIYFGEPCYGPDYNFNDGDW